MTESLCTACSCFANDFGEVEQRGWTSILNIAPDFHSLAELAQNGCPLCQTVYQSCCYIETVSYERDTLPIRVRASAPHGVGHDSYSDCDSIEGGDDDDDELPFRNQYPRQLDLTVIIGEKGQGRSHNLSLVIENGSERSTNTSGLDTGKPIINLCSRKGVDDAVALTKCWMLECETSHIKCNVRSHTKQQSRVLPTRLIDVGSIDEEEIPKIYVPDPPNHENLEYTALSYAWGSDPTFARTTASNISEMRNGLPWDKLAKTIQEAIVFTRKLGIKYLWVDALCILQSEGLDDTFHKEDWSYEAGRFGQYYENAVLTIAATGAVSSDKGLFLPRLALKFNPKPVTFRQKTFWGGIRDTTIQPMSPVWHCEMRTSPLLSRGWTFQERALSKRILHFGINCTL